MVSSLNEGPLCSEPKFYFEEDPAINIFSPKPTDSSGHCRGIAMCVFTAALICVWMMQGPYDAESLCVYRMILSECI